MIDDTERRLRDVLRRQAEHVDEDAVTGDTVRAHANLSRRRVGPAWAPVAAAAAIVALIAGVAVAVLDDPSHGRPGPATPAASVSPSDSSTATTHEGGSVPQCPSTTHAPGSTNTVCMIGHPPSLSPGQVIVRTVQTSRR